MAKLSELQSSLITSLRPRQEMSPVPACSDRAGWSAVRSATRAALIEQAETALNVPHAVITASDILRLTTHGDASGFTEKYVSRRRDLKALALGEACEGKGRFLGGMIDLCFMICEETAWTLPQNMRETSGKEQELPDPERCQLDAGAARTGALLATVLYMFREKLLEISPLLVIRLEREITLRLSDPFLQNRELDGGAENGLPVSKMLMLRECLTALLLTEREERCRWTGVKKAFSLLIEALDTLPEDGDLPGGLAAFPDDTGAALECLELINDACGGMLPTDRLDCLQRIGDLIVGSHIAGDYFAASGAQPARIRLDSSLLQRCGQLLDSDAMLTMGAYMLTTGDVHEERTLLNEARAVLGESRLLSCDPRPGMPLDYLLPSREMLCMRSRGGTSDGLFACIEGGRNTPGSHADAGNILLYMDGRPVLCDVGELALVRALPPSETETLWETQSQYHNLPVINGCSQRMGDTFGADDFLAQTGVESSAAVADIAHAYPPAAGVVSWRRTVQLTRGEQPEFYLWEIAELSAPKNRVEFNFITCGIPLCDGQRIVFGNTEILLPTDLTLKFEFEQIPPKHSAEYDPKGLYRNMVLSVAGENLCRAVLICDNAPASFSVRFEIRKKSRT